MTWLLDGAAGSERERVFALQPETAAALQLFLDTADAVTDRELLALCRTRIGQMLHCRAELATADPGLLVDLENWNASARFDERARAALDFTEQFVTSATDVSPEQGERLAQALGVPEPSTFVYGLYINEGLVRLLSFFDVAPESASAAAGAPVSAAKQGLEFLDWVDEDSSTDPRLLAAYHEFGRTACRHHGVDAVTDEMVRLRSAKMHDCKFCQSVRRTVELPDGVEDLMDAALAYERSDSVTLQQKVALELLDSFIFSPWALSDVDREQALEAFTAEQIVELMLKEVFWMSNKPMISLGTDPGPVTPGALTDFKYDGEGNFTILGVRV